MSDQCTAIINLCLQTHFRTKLFRFITHLLDNSNFLCVVSEIWNLSVEGDTWFILTLKLKRIKDALKILNGSVGNLREPVNSSREALLNFQNLMPSSPSVDQFTEERNSWTCI